MTYSPHHSFRNITAIRETFFLHFILSAFCLGVVAFLIVSVISNIIKTERIVSSIPKDQVVISPSASGESPFQVSSLTISDLALFNNIHGVKNIAPVTFQDLTINGVKIRFLATTPSFLEIENLDLEIYERLDANFPDGEIIISRQLSSQIFSTPIVIGRQLEVNNLILNVGNLFDSETWNNVIIVSPRQFLGLFNNYQPQEFVLQITDDFDIASVGHILEEKNLILKTYEDRIAFDKIPKTSFFISVAFLLFIITLNGVIFIRSLYTSRKNQFALLKVFGAKDSTVSHIVALDIIIWLLITTAPAALFAAITLVVI
ncbi:ABC transporter permease [Candidatus Saccharibacteria bacterium]|nr:ABC transporter permease [Candidatus Saccharibacteria bacterium]